MKGFWTSRACRGDFRSVFEAGGQALGSGCHEKSRYNSEERLVNHVCDVAIGRGKNI